jgi:hypothetical protein
VHFLTFTVTTWIRKGCCFVYNIPGIRRDVVLYSAPPNGCKDTTSIWIQSNGCKDIKKRRSFSVGIRWLEAEACTPNRAIAQIFVGLVLNVLSHL